MPKVWVRGVAGRLARIVPQGPYLPVDRWTVTELSNFIQRKADFGDLEISTTDPDAPKTAASKEAK